MCGVDSLGYSFPGGENYVSIFGRIPVWIAAESGRVADVLKAPWPPPSRTLRVPWPAGPFLLRAPVSSGISCAGI